MIKKDLLLAQNLDVVDSVSEETNKVKQLENDGITTEGIRIIDIQKYYQKWPCCRSKSDVQALKGVYLEIEDKELLTILGHNGAGKSTLIGVITGILASSYGTAKI